MKKYNTIFLLVIALAIGFASCTRKGEEKKALSLYAELEQDAVPNTLTEQEKQNGWKLLFDGKSIEGWHGYNMDTFPDFCWKIENGSLTMTTKGKGESLSIISKNTYDDFALSVEVKLTEGANSGVLFDVVEDTLYEFAYETGPEFQIIDHENWETPLEDWQIMGANYAMYPPIKRPYKEIGEWNHILLVVDENKVTQILNGEMVVEYEKYSDDWDEKRNSGKWDKFPNWGNSNKGHIALQNHGTKVWFRDIKLKVLD